MKGFRHKMGKFGSLVSLMLLCTMLILFAVNLPVFMGSTAGRIFAGAWAAFALVIFVSHSASLLAGQRRQNVLMPLLGKKDARTRKNNRRMRVVHG
ncbi:hypothetical protein [Sporomusa acidovorans]|uniref:Uncharacterized protein n=1 Tax=Sporomusa acidovorans (strain ATCC 49682 / DSM 3132 / Mol) TaxID=1123286 RepID=A0ABZ3J4W6_SPOA4|nr:hypothetical protein [Sporomusa acidovorans]OZC15510.1 hypothetical protein SPACI_48140 [Sporomusa acidovorans DSM 3132]SDE16698.1 hypothetical protein SAMN04488499_100942 [Sporomusa acidovorans]